MIDQQTLDTIEKVLHSIARKHTFGIYSVEDIKQEGFLLALEILESYDGTSPLENFLRVSLPNKLRKFQRNKTYRPHEHCSKCEEFSAECDGCVRRHNTQLAKKNLLAPINIDLVVADNEPHMMVWLSDNLEEKETIELINRELPVEYREDYLRMKENLYVSKPRRQEIEDKLRSIIN
jgi:DNA-directed RNA polymerase specialized sigma24 family protein